jgi:hypothetical protein
LEIQILSVAECSENIVGIVTDLLVVSHIVCTISTKLRILVIGPLAGLRWQEVLVRGRQV